MPPRNLLCPEVHVIMMIPIFIVLYIKVILRNSYNDFVYATKYICSNARKHYQLIKLLPMMNGLCAHL